MVPDAARARSVAGRLDVTTDKRSKTILVLSQVYVPDPASVGQHMADAAAGMARRGHRVVALVANRGYDDPSRKYPVRETRDGVCVRRLPLSSFGKKTILLRLLGQVSFLLQCILRGLFTRRLGCIFISTSPPMCPFAAIVIGWFRRVPIKYWAMDINPDQLVALGTAKKSDLSVRLFDALNGMILRRADDVIALDRFMADRLNRKLDVTAKMTVLPPWPHEDHLEPIPHKDNPFRHEHALEGKFVLMYSGNISPAHPVTTILEAAKRLADDRELLLMFIGGGLGKEGIERYVQREGLMNVRSLPYQPLDTIRYSLSAADLHLVAMGPQMVGIVHPCKGYGAMTVARPILLLGPRRSHVGQILDTDEVGWQIDHDDVDGAAAMIRQIKQTDPKVLADMGRRGRDVILHQFSKQVLCGRFCDVLERGIV